MHHNIKHLTQLN
uniref:Uncharacterized protein n=1 Tax=Arundo donax TaxID=35708 RepID=A0A0A9HXW5_ARUDO